MKYALVLIAGLVLGCGGLSKEDQGKAYLAAAEKYNVGFHEANLIWDQPSFEFFTYVDWALSMEKITLVFISDLNAVSWSDEYKEIAGRLVTCDNEDYMRLRAISSADDLTGAISALEAQQAQRCTAIANELRLKLGLDPVPDID